MPRESSKCREWEKERRIRLNEGFTTLCKLLPNYDPSTNASKVDILRHASSYIEELQERIKGLVSENNEAAKKLKKEEYKKLHERIKKLITKNGHLCDLLRDAKITIPPDCMIVKKFKRPMEWTDKILPAQAKVMQKNELQNENSVNSVKKRKFINKNKNKLCNQNGTPKHRKAILNRSDSKKLRPAKKKKIKTVLAPKCVLVLSQPSITQPCYVITNAPSNNLVGSSSTVITNSGLITNPLVSSKATKTIASIPSLGPGTLILANGTIMPVLPQPAVLPLASQIITRPPIIVVPRNSIAKTTTTTTENATPKVTTSGIKTLAPIKPKYCMTKTTQVNKVPIPALTSRYSNSEVVMKKPENKQVKAKTTEKKVAVTTKQVEKKPATDDGGEKRKVPEKESEVDEAKKARIEVEKPPEKEEDKAVEPTTRPPESVEQSKEIKIKEVEKKTAPVEEPKPVEVESKKAEDALDLNINHSELSNDIFASLQVPAGCQNPESTSPTAAFLLAFPLVSSLTGVKVTEVTEEDNAESQRGTPTLLQIGTMNSTKPTPSESLTPSLLNLDNLSFFSSKDITGFYNSFEATNTTNTAPSSTATTTSTTATTAVGEVKTVAKEEQVLMEKKVCRQQPHNNSNSKNDLVPCFDNRFSQQQIAYQSKQSVVKSVDVKQQQQQVVCSNYTSQKFCNNFNEAPKVGTTCAYSNQIKSYSDPLYTNSNTYSYTNSENNFNQNYYKGIAKTTADSRSYYSLNYENYTDYRKNDTNTYFPATTTINYHTNSHKFVQKTSKNVQSRPPINWMTTPDNRGDYVLPQFPTTKENDFSHNTIYPTNTFANTQTTYFTNSMYTPSNETGQDARKSLDLPLVPPVNTSYPRNEIEENQFSWSPTKIPQFLETPHSFVSSTLPTLVGDLALGNPLGFTDQKDKCQKKDSRRLKNYESGNFLSVSQLVDHNKEAVPARTAARRNSGNRSSGKKVPQKTSQRKDSGQKVEPGGGKGSQMKQMPYSGEMFCESKPNRNVVKNSYSAEALIGHQMQSEGQKNRQNYNGGNKPISVSSFLHDNIIPYFPTVDLPQDNSYMQQNQNYQTTSFSHNFPANFQNNTYIPTTTISSSYNFIHDVSAPTHDYSDNLNLFPQINKDKPCGTKSQTRTVRDPQCVAAPKKTKRKHANESNLPGFVDFPFLSMPASINSPILPDDFHTHTGFLQPPTPQLYSCKNPFTKPNDLLPLPVPVTKSNIQHPEISPSINNAGTSLTNFNLCTIFPEMNNKSVLADSYPVKEQPRCYSSAAQVSFNDKPTFSFSYNSSTSQNYNNQ